MHLRVESVVLVTNKTLRERERAETHQSIAYTVPNVNMLCCFDKGHSDCIVDLATVLGEALGVDVTNSVNRKSGHQHGHKTTKQQ